MNVRVPFEWAAKCMQDTNEARSKIPGLIHVKEETQYNRAHSLKKTVQERAIFKEEDTEFFRNSEDAVAMFTFDQFSSHSSCAFSGVKITAGGTETRMTAERYEFEMTAERASIHGTSESGITTIDHLVDVFNFDRTRMQSIYDFFIVVTKNLLEYIHSSIMKQRTAKRKPPPLKIEGQGS